MIANVIVDVPSQNTNRLFDYEIPEKFEGIVQPGVRVIVPFGPRKILGYVITLSETSAFSSVKKITDVLDVIPTLTDELLQLGKWLSRNTLSYYISCLQVMLPQVMKAKYRKELWKLTEEPLNSELDAFFDGRAVVDFEEFEQSGISYHTLRKHMDDGVLDVHYEVKSRETKKTVTNVEPVLSSMELEEKLVDLSPQAKKQRKIIEYFLEYPETIEKKRLLEELSTTSASLKPLVNQGILREFKKEVFRDPYGDREFERTEPFPLTNEQETAIEPILQNIEDQTHDVFLLHGVTGSGKTEVYLQSIQQVIDKGEEAIMLVPEIALTPQMVERFKGRFGSKVAVLHSALSAGEKYDEWRKIQRREVQVVVGARSAIFAPFTRIGLIIIDEEHETSYKQEDRTRYHARDVAIERGKTHQCPVVLGSATPALESYARAVKGNYKLLTMSKRMNESVMPEVELVDMREELHSGNRSMFSIVLKEKIEERIARGEQVVLFLNRRGYSTFVMCRDCGHVSECPHCDIALTYHKRQNRLKCHYCSHEEPMPSECPECESKTIRYFGTGTQKVEEALQELIPEARVIRMDVDTTRRKGAHEKHLKKFGDGQADILLGTQMIAKGLDFGNVTLVGVLAADALLNLPDFRASEKTFQLLTQVSGRAGRHEKAGEVVVQTYSPEHYSIELASQYDYEQFFKEEMKLRKAFRYPPYFYLTLFTISHPNQLKVQEVTQKITMFMQQRLSDQAYVLGPTPSALTRINNRYRYQCMIKYKNEPEQRTFVERILHYYEDEMKQENGLQITVDFQPYQLM
ncbi:primosomal protein N' [Halobacillus karajensis]|uniref:Replication restart protein PriA n=1 Tax=Halobacillus karajensis TaxID=195088 RepID=A0A024P2H3_9BACI|nr:primosomal protein N' [Halobacillus karajensis]CDQ19803.1 Primosomal protein N' [Halobacillus karajensis]CDQ22263.1 Primosomal protein N' [Halobacillus karajensis]CDQ28104.1 Primosomal protein N' [Halobacillus karajensis]